MPAYATNMRLKFPILALILEIITIILFAVFVVYDDGKGHGHNDHNATHHEEKPMDLYPSDKNRGGAQCHRVACGVLSPLMNNFYIIWSFSPQRR
ncbi:ammonium transporter Rh type A [Solea senegalensis]|uniref:Ammonium transporter Rh type A n=1 Tax=Solea senegalensis TaxID=28829 RepID=A0AAV6RU20_SOLSE|nr:ammonium transporter Rh type A [Solea senegalensis]